MKNSDLEIARFVDGEMSRDEQAAFAARVAADPALRTACADAEGLRGMFRAGRAEAAPQPSADFRARVLAEIATPVGVEPFAALRLRVVGRAVLCAAAVVVIAAALVAVVAHGRNAGSGRLEASPADVQRAMADLDAQIESAVGGRGPAPAEGAGRR